MSTKPRFEQEEQLNSHENFHPLEQNFLDILHTNRLDSLIIGIFEFSKFSRVFLLFIHVSYYFFQ